MKLLSTISLVIILLGCANDSQPSKKELPAAIEEFNQAFSVGDTTKLASMITEDYVHTNGSWKSFGKEKWLGYMSSRAKKLANGSLKITAYQMDEVEIRYHGNSAWVTGSIHTEGIENEVPFQKSFRVSNLWIYNGSRWLRAGFHDTIIR